MSISNTRRYCWANGQRPCQLLLPGTGERVQFPHSPAPGRVQSFHFCRSDGCKIVCLFLLYSFVWKWTSFPIFMASSFIVVFDCKFMSSAHISFGWLSCSHCFLVTLYTLYIFFYVICVANISFESVTCVCVCFLNLNCYVVFHGFWVLLSFLGRPFLPLTL